MRSWLLFVSLSSAVLAQSLDLPKVGCVATQDSRLRTLLGLRGNFVLGDLAAPEDCWQGETLSFDLPMEIGEPVLSIARAQNGNVLVLTSGWLYTLDPDSGEVITKETAAEGAASALVWPDKAMLILRDGALWFRTSAGEERTLDAECTQPLRWIERDWAQCGNYAMHRKSGEIELFILPGESQ